jgi:hypothetical protein
VRALPAGDADARPVRQAHERGRHRIDVNDPARPRRRSSTRPASPPGRHRIGLGRTVIDYNLPGLPATFFLDSRHRIVKRVTGRTTELTTGAALIGERAGRG